MSTPTFCHETYCDAVTWTVERRAREIRGYCEQMRDLYDPTCPERTDCIIQEIRAVRHAQADVRDHHPYRALLPAH
jgi:hypothetical protein